MDRLSAALGSGELLGYWQPLALGALVGSTLFDTYVAARQKPFLSLHHFPAPPLALVPYLARDPHEHEHEHGEGGGKQDARERAGKLQSSYEKSLSYAADKLRLRQVLGLLDTLSSFVLLSSVAAPLCASVFSTSASSRWTLLRGFWDWSAAIQAQVPLVHSARTGDIYHALIFTWLLSTIGTVIEAPKSAFKHFVLEEKHGFNKMTVRTFFEDLVKGYALSLAIELPVLAGVLKIIDRVGGSGVLRIVSYLLAFISTVAMAHSVGFQLVLIPLYPYVIAPLFNKFTPLDESSPVYPRIHALASRLGFPLGKIWVMDGSRRSAHSNAYFFGLPGLSKQIVIFDTLLDTDKTKPEEVEAIVAHELGHWHGNHIPVLLVTSIVQTALTLSIFALFLTNGTLLEAFGFPQSRPLASSLTGSSGGGGDADLARPTIVALMLASTLFTPLGTMLQFALNAVTRLLEYNADAFAYRVGGPDTAEHLKSALVRIHEDNLSLNRVDALYSAYENNHPELIERLDALDTLLASDTKKSS